MDNDDIKFPKVEYVPEDRAENVLSSVKDAKDKALALKQDDSIQSTDARRWAIVFTDLEKIEAYIQMFLVEED